MAPSVATQLVVFNRNAANGRFAKRHVQQGKGVFPAQLQRLKTVYPSFWEKYKKHVKNVAGRRVNHV